MWLTLDLCNLTGKVEKILKDRNADNNFVGFGKKWCLQKIKIMGWKVFLRCKGKTLLGIVKKLLKTTFENKKFVDITQLVWIFTEGQGEGIESRLSSWIFSTLAKQNFAFLHFHFGSSITKYRALSFQSE